MNGEQAHKSAGQIQQRRKQQAESLRQNEAALGALAADQNKEEFFNRITPLFGPLKSYIERRLRVASADGEIRTQLYNSSDILDEVVLRAYEQYGHKPADLTLEQWLYRIANQLLERYLKERKARDTRGKSLEDFRTKELKTLEELKEVTADAEGEVWLAEDLDDAEYNAPEFTPPQENLTPEQELERKEEIDAAVRALSRVPVEDRIVFELYKVQGFSKEEVARIVDVSPDQVPRIAEMVRRQVLREIGEERRPAA
jgi:RNA polymerase sigma factor (sigma-70 family)